MAETEKRPLEEEDDDEEIPLRRKVMRSAEESASLSTQCPYLDTIDRHVLDFDFEKLCSVSLSRINVYACLVCGKYFQVGREEEWSTTSGLVYLLALRVAATTPTPTPTASVTVTGSTST